MLFKKKIDMSLKYMIDNNTYNKYRVIINYGIISRTIEKKIKSTRGILLYDIKLVNCICALVTRNCIISLTELPEVKYICLDESVTLCSKNILHSNGVFIDNSVYSPLKDQTISGKGIGIGLIDSGVYPHNDLSNPSNKVKEFIDILNNLNYPYDDNGHGTFMAGTICAYNNNKKSKQHGIAINSDLIVIKAFNRLGKSYISTILYSFEYLYNNRKEYNLKVICAPFQSDTCNKFLLNLTETIFLKFKKLNIIIVVPSGNNESTEDSIKGIALSGNVITVGGINTNGTYCICDYSCCGSVKYLKKPDFVAASDDIIGLNSDCSYVSEANGEKLYPRPLNTPYTIKSGTSIACAFIAGICALLFEVNNDFTFDDIYTLLKINSVLINEHKSKQGNGYINLSKLVNTDFTNIKLPGKKSKKTDISFK